MVYLVNIMKFLYHSSNPFMFKSSNKICRNVPYKFFKFPMINCCRSYCIILEPEENQKQKKIKTPRIPKITLINLDQSKTIVLLEDAMKLAKRNNFHLIKLLYTDGSDEREVYKLCTHKEIIANETERNDNVKNHESIKFKSFKVFSIDTKITEYDLDVKLKNINKLLQKGHRIKLLLKHYDNQKEQLLKHVKCKVEGTIAVERQKGNCVICTYHPVLNNASDSSKKI